MTLAPEMPGQLFMSNCHLFGIVVIPNCLFLSKDLATAALVEFSTEETAAVKTRRVNTNGFHSAERL